MDAWLIRKPKANPTSTLTSNSDPLEVLKDGSSESTPAEPIDVTGDQSSSETPIASEAPAPQFVH